MSSSSSEEEEAEQVGHETLALSENNAVDVISADSPGRPLVIHGGVFNNLIAGNQNVIVNISRDENNSDSDFAKHANEFLRRVKIHLNKTVGDCGNLTSEPTKMLLDTEGSKKSGMKNANAAHGNTDTLFGKDLKPIELDELHDDCNDKPSRHVMILGEAGAGKTTLTRMYSARVAEKKVESLGNIELVHIVSAIFVHGEFPSTAFDLLFSQQMSGDADTELSPKVAKAGERWVNENAEKILLVIDGLDQLAKIIGGRNHPNINAFTPSSSDHIIANVMSGNIWRGARVLTSSRWDAYWSLMAAQKSDKVIGLRGFDDENMKKAIFRRINDEGISATLLHDLQGTAKLLALCRTPIFLKYASEIFLDNAKKLPDSISGLMSEIFYKFLHSTHASEPEIDGLTRLAYDSTLEKRFHFTKRYMEKFGVKPDKLKGFLSCGTNLPPGIDKPVPDDITYVFTHETLQEFCCALHIVNLEPPAVRKFIGETLQESRMEMIRKLLYGVMLDDNNTRSLRSYLEDRSCSIEECQDILLMLFPHLIPNKTIDDIKVVHLLSECGADRIHQIRECVQNIHIDAYHLLPNDQITLATIIKQTSPLKNVFIREVVFDKSLVQHLMDCPRHAERYEVYILTISEDKDMPASAYKNVAPVLNAANCTEMVFVRCNLTGDKLHQFGRGCSEIGVTLEFITIADKTMAEDGYRELSKVIGASKCRGISLSSCEINKDKLIAFHDESRNQHIQLTELKVFDKSMPADAFREFSSALDVTQCKKVVFGNCQLTSHKLSEFGSGCSDHGLSLEFIAIADKTMAEDGYRELSKVIGASKCMGISLEDCEINMDKLIAFHDECRKQHIQLATLKVFDSSMPSEAFRELSAALDVTQCNNVVFGNCGLTSHKLSEFGSGCSDHGLALELITIVDKTMAEDGYRELSKVIGASKCMGLRLEDCELNKDKLIALHDECRNQHIQLTELNVWDNSIPADAFREFSTTLDVTQCKKVVFGNCELTSHKLSKFGSGCSHYGLSLEVIAIVDKTMAEDGYRELSKVIGASNCSQLVLQFCELNKDKVIAFHDECRNKHIQLNEFIVLDNWMPPDVFREVATTLQVTRCKKIDFTFCGLTSRKLSEFSSGCSENGLSLEWITINDKKMIKDVYKELSKLTGITECPWLRLQRCDLSKEKLLTFNNECQDQNIQLDKLDILDATMPADVYHAVCNTFYVTKCQEISFIKCDITPSKLQSFLTQSQKHRLTIAKLQIIEFKPDSVPTNEMVSVLCDLMSDVVEVLVICGWELNAGQLELMENTRRLTSSKAKVVTVMNKTSTSRDKNPYPTVWKNGEVVEVPREWIVAFYGFYKDENPYNENLMSSFDSFLMSA